MYLTRANAPKEDVRGRICVGVMGAANMGLEAIQRKNDELVQEA